MERNCSGNVHKKDLSRTNGGRYPLKGAAGFPDRKDLISARLGIPSSMAQKEPPNGMLPAAYSPSV